MRLADLKSYLKDVSISLEEREPAKPFSVPSEVVTPPFEDLWDRIAPEYTSWQRNGLDGALNVAVSLKQTTGFSEFGELALVGDVAELVCLPDQADSGFLFLERDRVGEAGAGTLGATTVDQVRARLRKAIGECFYSDGILPGPCPADHRVGACELLSKHVTFDDDAERLETDGEDCASCALLNDIVEGEYPLACHALLKNTQSSEIVSAIWEFRGDGGPDRTDASLAGILLKTVWPAKCAELVLHALLWTNILLPEKVDGGGDDMKLLGAPTIYLALRALPIMMRTIDGEPLDGYLGRYETEHMIQNKDREHLETRLRNSFRSVKQHIDTGETPSLADSFKNVLGAYIATHVEAETVEREDLASLDRANEHLSQAVLCARDLTGLFLDLEAKEPEHSATERLRRLLCVSVNWPAFPDGLSLETLEDLCNVWLRAYREADDREHYLKGNRLLIRLLDDIHRESDSLASVPGKTAIQLYAERANLVAAGNNVKAALTRNIKEAVNDCFELHARLISDLRRFESNCREDEGSRWSGFAKWRDENREELKSFLDRVSYAEHR